MGQKSKVVELTPAYVTIAVNAMAKLTKEERDAIAKYATDLFVREVHRGLEGEVGYDEAPFFEVIDRMYRNAQPKGCYFCDADIDGNEVPFDYPDSTRLCLECQLKVANLLVAFGIDPQCLFPGMGERKRQKILYDQHVPKNVGRKNVLH